FCFWACMAVATGARSDRYVKKAKKLFEKFYQKKPNTIHYKSFDYVNELERYENCNTAFAINIVKYYEDDSLEYVHKSKHNDTRTRNIYLNLYQEHFSYITNLEQLAKMYVCPRCSGKFQDNFHLQRHIDICNLEQQDKFVLYPEVYEKKRNEIVELSEWFDVECDYKHDYLITFDFESMMDKITDVMGDKLKFVSKHIPVSVSIATNVPGFDITFIESNNPRELVKQMFDYLDQVAKMSEELMTKKMKPLITKI